MYCRLIIKVYLSKLLLFSTQVFHIRVRTTINAIFAIQHPPQQPRIPNPKMIPPMMMRDIAPSCAYARRKNTCMILKTNINLNFPSIIRRLKVYFIVLNIFLSACVK